MPNIKFDFDGARKAGATDDQIVGYLSETYSDQFDFGGAKAAGASSGDILGYLSTPAAPQADDGVSAATGTDYLKGFAVGSNKLASGIGYLAEKLGADEAGPAIRAFGDRGAQYWTDAMSEGGELAAQEQVFEDDPDSIIGVRLGDKWGQALMMGASQSAPSMFAAAGPGALVAKGIQALAKLGLAGGAGATIPLIAGTASPIGITANIAARAPAAIGFGAAEGVTAGAMNAADLQSSIENTPLEELEKSPVFVKLKAEHGEEKARTMLAKQAAWDVFKKTAPVTGTIGALTGGGALGQAYQKGTAGVRGGITKQILKGVGLEAIQETPQSGAETYIQQVAERDYLDPSIDPSKGVLAAALSGGAIGGLTGGVVGAGGGLGGPRGLSGKGSEEPPPSDAPPGAPPQATATDAQVEQPVVITRPSGQPFETAEQAQRAAAAGGLQGYVTQQVEGGFALAPATETSTLQTVLAPETSLDDAIAATQAHVDLPLAPDPNSPTTSDIARAQVRSRINAEIDARSQKLATRKQAELDAIQAESKLPAALYDASRAESIRVAIGQAEADTLLTPMQLAFQQAQQRAEQPSAAAEPATVAPRGTVEQSASTPPADVVRKNGAPFQTEKSAALAARVSNLAGYLPAQVAPGQWVLRAQPQEIQPVQPAVAPPAVPPTPIIEPIQPQQPPVSTPVTRSKANVINPRTDDLLAAIGKLGGLDATEAGAQGLDPALWGNKGGARSAVFGRPWVRKSGGLSFDAMAEALNQHGYFPPGVPYSPNALLDLIGQQLGGRKVFAPAGVEAQAEQEALQRDLDDAARTLDEQERADLEQVLDEAVAALDDVSMAQINEDLAVLAGTEREYYHGIEENLDEAVNNAGDSQALGEEIAGEPGADNQRREQGARQEAGAGERESTDLLGTTPPVKEQALADERLSGEQVPVGEGKGDLFTEASKQADIADIAAPTSAKPIKEVAPTKTKKQFTYAIKPEGDGFVIESDDGGGVVLAKKPSGFGVLDSTPARIFTTEADASDYLNIKGMQEAKTEQSALPKEGTTEPKAGTPDTSKEVTAITTAVEKMAGIVDKLADKVEAIGQPSKVDNNQAEVDKEATGKIEDFGEKITGARKEYAAAYKDRMDEAKKMDVLAQPLSKSWPEPDYQKLVDSGYAKNIVGLVRSMRDEIPNKPGKAWRQKTWAKQVELLRDSADKLLNDPEFADKFISGMKKAEHINLDDAINGRAELYELLGHEKSLKGIRISRGEYSVFNGVPYNPPKIIWEVTKDTKATAFGNMPKTLGSGETRQAAIESFHVAYSTLDTNKEKDSKTKFELYANRYAKPEDKGQFFIGKKVGRNVIHIKDGFDTAKEARVYMAEHNAELTAILEQKKAVPNERHDTNKPRVGQDMRNAQDVTPQMFQDAFGFRGVQFGNYVEGARRQKDLNDAYDALMDLAAVLDIPPKAISLNGELGLAFGARGSGGKNAHSAHYEPGQVVINLTKGSGAGSLAHEWWHSLDNYFSRLRGKKDDYATDSRDVKDAARNAGYPLDNTGIRKEMIEAFGAVVRAINNTAIRQRSVSLDARRTKEYWGTGIEMSARSFERYVIAKLHDNGFANDYLANVVSEEYWDAADALGIGEGGSYPYPTESELPAIRAGFDQFFQTIETKETEQGVALFSRRADTKAAYEARIDDLFGGGKARAVGARVLDASDVLRLIGYGDKPVNLAEGKVVSGRYTHGLTAEHWKKIPEWLDNPVAVFDSDTVDGRLVFIAPDTISGKPIVMIVEPNVEFDEIQVNLLVNAYDKTGGRMPIQRWVNDGLLRYLDETKSHAFAVSSGLRLPSKAPQKHGSANRVFSSSDLVKLRQESSDGADLFSPKNSNILFSRTPDNQASSDTAFAQEVISELAAVDEFFRFPVSDSSSLEQVMSDVFPEATYNGEDTRADERAESGADHRFMFKTEIGKTFYVFERGNEAWIDVSRLDEGGGGSAIYAAVGNYAHNAGKRFVGDPNGLSEAAIVRRTSNMLSLALRFGTTRFMEASPEQIKGDPANGIAPLAWRGDDVAKVRALIDTFLSTLHNQFPRIKNALYDFQKRQFIGRDGVPIDRAAFQRIANQGVGREARAGEATLRRGIFIQSLVSSKSGQRPGILEQVLNRNRALVEQGGLQGLFARPNQEAPPGAGLSVSEVRAEIGAEISKAKSSKVRVIADWSGLPKKQRDNVYSKRAFDVQGVLVPDSGEIYLVANNISKGAAFSVLMHEAGVHLGLEGLIGASGVKRLSNQIRVWSTATGDKDHHRLAKIAVARVPKGTPAIHRDQEIIAYFVEEAVKAGHGSLKPEGQGPTARWFRQLWQMVREAIAALGADPSKLTTDDIVALARGALERSLASGNITPAMQGLPAYSRSRANTPDEGAVQGGEVTPFHEENERLREKDKTAWVRAKKFMQRQFLPGGLLPKSIFDEKISRDSNFNAIEFYIRHQVGGLENAVRSDYGVKFIDLPVDTVEKLSQALSGNVPEGIPEKTRTAIYSMRQYIDALSTDYANTLDAEVSSLLAGLDNPRVALDAYLGALADGTQKDAEAAAKSALGVGVPTEGLVKAARAQIIRNNIGEYVHRSYQAFDDPKWFKKLGDATINAARAYLTGRYEESGMSAEESGRKAEIAMHEILKNGTAYDSFSSFVKEGKLGAKDLSVMIRRKQIAPEIRALLGEYKDARLNYAKSATKMGRLIWNQKFLDAVRKRGIGVFLFEGDDRPPQATKQIAGEANESYAPLNGLWTFPDVEQGLRDALGKEHMDRWYETIVQLNGIVKFGKTVLSPTTAARNWQSAMFFALANGHFNLGHISKSVSGLREYFTHQGEGAKLAYLQELLELGVIYDNPYAGEMMRLLADSKLDEKLLRGKDPLKLGQAIEYAQKFYQYGDDFWKIVGFENEKNLLMKHAGMSETEAKKEAAQRVRNTYPTYSMVGRAMNFLRRFPLAGTFVSFPSEIIRTVGNMIGYIAKDMKTPGMRPLAMRRIAGFSIAASFAYALQAMTKLMLGVDDDDEEAIRDLAPTWSKNSNFLFIGRDESGRLQYVDLSYVDPYNYFKRPVTAILRDQPWENIAADVFRETLEPFLGTDIAAGAIFEVLSNKKEYGGQVYIEGDKPWQQTADIANHLRRTLQPGLASNLERTYKAIAGEVSQSGKKFKPMEEAAGWVGWRMSTIDPKVALYYRTFEFKDGLRDASAAFNKTARDPNKVSNEQLKSALERTRSLREDAFRQMGRIVNAAKSGGLSDADITRILRNSQVSMRDIVALRNGRVPPWRPSMASEQGAMRKARTLLGTEKATEIRRRYREAMKMSNSRPQTE